MMSGTNLFPTPAPALGLALPQSNAVPTDLFELVDGFRPASAAPAPDAAAAAGAPIHGVVGNMRHTFSAAPAPDAAAAAGAPIHGVVGNMSHTFSAAPAPHDAVAAAAAGTADADTPMDDVADLRTPISAAPAPDAAAVSAAAGTFDTDTPMNDVPDTRTTPTTPA